MTRQMSGQQSKERKRNERPVPDEAPLEESARGEMGRSARASRRRLTRHEWVEIVKRASKAMLDDNMPMIAQALAFSTFIAIPSVLLVALGMFTLLASPQAITTLMHHFGSVMPQQTTELLGSSLTRLNSHASAGVVMIVVGMVLALWSTTGAMTTYMAALNIAYKRDETRPFVRRRLLALAMVACIGLAFLLVAVLLLFGPTIEHYLGQTLGIESMLGYLWWAAQWPILIVGLLAAFATLLYLAPNLDQRRWTFLSVGSAAAVVVWLIVSGGFAFYTAHFSSYNKTWGSLSAVIIMLTWLWLTGLALLFGGELNAEAERIRLRSRPDSFENAFQSPQNVYPHT
jgi:membrane protein